MVGKGTAKGVIRVHRRKRTTCAETEKNDREEKKVKKRMSAAREKKCTVL